MIILLFLLISTASNAQITNYQSLKAKLPIPLMGHITAVYNNHLFVFGGKNGSNNNDYIAFNDKFWKLPLSAITLETSDIGKLVVINEPADNDWFQISVKPPTYGAASNIGIGSNTFVCEHQCSVMVDRYLYMFGPSSFGSKNNDFVNTVYRLDLSSNPPIFASKNDLYVSNLNIGKPFCVTAAMGNIYINTLFERIKFNPMNDKLQIDTIKDIPQLNVGCASNYKQDKIYLLGGKNDSYWQGSFNIYDYTIGTNTNHSIRYPSYNDYNLNVNARNRMKCISLAPYSFNIECPGGLDIVNDIYKNNSIIWNTYNNSQTYVNLQTGVAQYALELYQIGTAAATNYNASIIFVIGGANDETGIEKAIDTIQYSVRYESVTDRLQRLHQFVDASIRMILKHTKMKEFRKNAMKGVKRRLESYVDDAYDYYDYDDNDDDDDWIDDLSFDEATYLYDLLKSEYDQKDDTYYDQQIDYGYDLDRFNYDMNYEVNSDGPKICNSGSSTDPCKLSSDGNNRKLEKIHCKNSDSCKVECTGSCKSYIKTSKTVKDVTFNCKDECKNAIILMSSTRIHHKNKINKEVGAKFECSASSCSPKFIAFYMVKHANITGPGYPTRSQINFIGDTKAKANANIKITAENAFTHCSIYTQHLTTLTILVDAKKSFQDVLLDVRGVYNVEINCTKENACDRLVVRYEQKRCKEAVLKIFCAADACQDLKLVHESTEDKTGNPKQCDIWKTVGSFFLGKNKFKDQIPKITISDITKNIKISPQKTDINETIIPSSAEISSKCTKRTLVWYDKHQDATAYGTYQWATTSDVCVKLTKDEQDLKLYYENSNGFRVKRRTNFMSKNSGTVSHIGAGADMAASIATDFMQGSGAFGSAIPGLGAAISLVTVITENIGSWIEMGQNLNIERFRIKPWEDDTKESSIAENDNMWLEIQIQEIQKEVKEIKSKLNKASVGGF